ncbi:hypothetical protein TNCV_5042781 [Trichonephila clavipes]|nr:hypothetical protein TNCV_5042781 [Trichonephila clavipes]
MNKKLSFITPEYVPHDHHHRKTCDKSSNGRVQHVRMYRGYFISFSSDKLDGPDRYTRKISPQPEVAGVKSGDRGSHGYLQRLLMILSSPNVCIRNTLTGLAV